ncbi:NarL family two-component system sensor histidine kinase LiaS [Bacillus mesophilus]|uniref:Sensor histidine kinase n=1 Tax=Bacillus mesophilus TaxID=1808955 RepID=A0A6M0QBI4_9BACI|nr:sensor histidine kinase [Bacillus mesophilus]MBM7662984.1 NarL family two-component system sensor histidine kinase LiaS [Bacillus mesophilus]NEY73692.1 sensor histidine kinase [Bacillus mesophilus]
MSILQKHILIGIFVTFITTILVLITTFITFPLQNWSELSKVHLFGIPYWVLVSTVGLGVGLISGISYALFWREKLQHIYRQIDELLRGQKITRLDSESIEEVNAIQQQLFDLEVKFKKQAEASQRLATERANEREQSLQEVVVQERNRLARELHDSVSQQLFGASMLISAINVTNSSLEDSEKKQLMMVENMINQSQMDLRALLLHLRPAALKGKTLKAGVEELLKELTNKVPMTIESKIESFDIDKGVEDQLFRILQEAVSNALRHAKANLLNVMLIERDDHVILRVVDDGIGFKVEEEKTSTYGLRNMHERALEVGGTLKIISIENQGTRLEVKVPYIKKGLSDND